jgi:subtilisin family serine protease
LLVDTHSVFRPLRSRGGLIGARDFVQPGGNLFIRGGHGTGVLSLIVAQEPELWGAAPAVDVLLLRSENNARETLAEEAAWVAAAEYADSVGVDIFQTSLGYSIFEGGVGNHSYASLDGNTALITRGADIAASKGILVVNSLGNEGITNWRYLLAPADGDSVLAVGAVDSQGQIANFSSWGPRVDGRIKPDVVAQGAEVVIFDPNRGFSETIGTSYSSPLIAGLAACLLQARPRSTGWDLYRALTGSADRYRNPDNRYGNGQPFGPLALLYLPPNEGIDTLPGLRVYVTPEADRLFIWGDSGFARQPKLELVSLQGQVVATNQPGQIHDPRLPLVWLLDNRLAKGVYQLRAYAGGQVYRTRFAVVQSE